jgi:hypothetical protein
MNDSRLSLVLNTIDTANAADPRHTAEGKAWEMDHAERLTEWVVRLRPEASELLRIAARGQHIERWITPRTAYPEGRTGYLRWREDLKTFHAKRTGKIMLQAGYTPDERDRVASLITKTALRDGDPEGQVLEDALCLVFLETQFKDLLNKTSEPQMTAILRKTWQKMSASGQTAAQTLPLSPEEKQALSRALQDPPQRKC